MRIRKKHSRIALMTAVSLTTTIGANAQQAEPLEEVIVTGFRASQADALENKRLSNQIIESVSAEDLGKFPDQNVAESLQRLPGVLDRPLQRRGHEGQDPRSRPERRDAQ